MFLIFSALLLVLELVAVGGELLPGDPPFGAGRIVVLLALLIAVYTGRAWARVVLVALLILGVLGGGYVAMTQGDPIAVVMSSSFAALGLGFAALLFFPTPVREFLDAQSDGGGLGRVR